MCPPAKRLLVSLLAAAFLHAAPWLNPSALGAVGGLFIVAPASGQLLSSKPEVVVKATSGFIAPLRPLKLVVNDKEHPVHVTYGEQTAILVPKSPLPAGVHRIYVRSDAALSGEPLRTPAVEIRVEGEAGGPGGSKGSDGALFTLHGSLKATLFADKRGVATKLPFDLAFESRETLCSTDGFLRGAMRLPLLTPDGPAGPLDLRLERFGVRTGANGFFVFGGDRPLDGEQSLLFGETPLRGIGLYPDDGTAGARVHYGRSGSASPVSLLGWVRPDGGGLTRTLVVWGEEYPLSFGLHKEHRFGRWTYRLESAGSLRPGGRFIDSQAASISLERPGLPRWRVRGLWVGTDFRMVNGRAVSGKSLSVERSGFSTWYLSASPSQGFTLWDVGWRRPVAGAGMVEASLARVPELEPWKPEVALSLQRRFLGGVQAGGELRLLGFAEEEQRREGEIEIAWDVDGRRIGARLAGKTLRQGGVVQTEVGVEALSGWRLAGLGDLVFEATHTRRGAKTQGGETVVRAVSTLEARLEVDRGRDRVELSVTGRIDGDSTLGWNGKLEYSRSL